jgi:YebC/PmpR family DNA-binding regulatory protein
MSGHSKWATIKHRKGAQDAKRGKIFSKLIREITVAARVGGNDIDNNSRLRLVVDKAYDNNMSKDTIERAISRGVGGGEETHVDEVVYEGYGPSGVAVLVRCMTDNRNRTVAEVRHAFTRMGGNLGTSGSVSYLFQSKGQLIFAPGADENKIMEAGIEFGAEDVIVNDDKSIEVITAPDQLTEIKEKMQKLGLKSDQAEVSMIPTMNVTLDQETAEKVIRLTDMLEDLDDVQTVYTNADISNEILEKL